MRHNKMQQIWTFQFIEVVWQYILSVVDNVNFFCRKFNRLSSSKKMLKIDKWIICEMNLSNNSKEAAKNLTGHTSGASHFISYAHYRPSLNLKQQAAVYLSVGLYCF